MLIHDRHPAATTVLVNGIIVLKFNLIECKKSQQASKQPNQEYYVKQMDGMSFSRFVYPENKEAVLNELQQAFKP